MTKKEKRSKNIEPMRFYLIQRGNFNNNGDSLTGNTGVVNLDYMGSAEFEFSTIPSSYRRIMHDFKEYDYTRTGITTKDGDEVIVFAKKDMTPEVVAGIINYVKEPYMLKEYSELDRIPELLSNGEGRGYVRTNFWWCVENGKDWMAFLKSKQDLFETGIDNDYNNWWMKKDKETREKEFIKSKQWYY